MNNNARVMENIFIWDFLQWAPKQRPRLNFVPVVQRKGGREEIIFSVNTPVSIKYCGGRMNSRAALKTSALCRRAIIIKYYSVEKKCSNRRFLNRNKYAAHQHREENNFCCKESSLLHSCFLNVIFVCKLNNILIFVCKVRKQCKS